MIDDDRLLFNIPKTLLLISYSSVMGVDFGLNVDLNIFSSYGSDDSLFVAELTKER